MTIAGVAGVNAADASTSVVGTFRPTTAPPGADPLFPRSNDLYADIGARTLYAYSRPYNWLAAYDLDSLRPLGPGVLAPGGATAFYPDPTGRGMFVAFSEGAGVRVDLFSASPSGISRSGTLDVTAALANNPVVGMYRVANAPVLWVIAAPRSGPTTMPGGVIVAQIDLRGFDTGAARVQWAKAVGGCTQLMAAHANIPAGFGYVPASNSLVFGCTESSNPFVHPPTPRGAGMVSLNGDVGTGASTPGDFALYPHAGEFSRGDALFDPLSGRLAMAAYSSVTNGNTLFVFDGATKSYVGGVSAGGNELRQIGMDPVAGRVYALSQTHGVGLILADVRPTPVSQGVTVPELRSRERWVDSAGALAIDSVTRRVFLKYENFDDWLIVRDNVPVFVPEPGIDPDSNTSDVDEVPGKTEAAFSAAGQAYGAVVRQVGGFDAMTINMTATTGYPVILQMGTREFRSSYLNSLHLKNAESSASAITADVDRANTRQDLINARPPNPDENAEPADPFVNWPYEPAQCADFGDSPGDRRSSSASVSCHAKEQLVSAEATDRGTDANSVLVSDSFVKGSSRLDEAKGVVATVHANARGISILGGLLQIGEVDVVAEAHAKGRPGTADGAFRRTLKNVRLNGQELCADRCDPKSVAEQVNAALGPQGIAPSAVVRVDFPEPDARYLDGSRKGFQALVTSSHVQHLEDVLLNEQPEERIEVPGMVITISQDNIKPGRTVVYLAGAAVEARYGISVRGEGGVDGPGGPRDPEPGAGEIGGPGPLFGLPPGITGPPGTNNEMGVPAGSGGAGGPLGAAGRFLINNVGRMLDLLPVWGVLLLPIYLSARRWLLLQRSTLIGGKS